jgi:hypothetical protein
MNFIEYLTTVHAFALFIEFFLYVNQNNPVRHVFVAMYVYLFYLFLREKFAMDQLEMDMDNLFMNNQCLVSCMEPKNNTHGQLM